MDEFLTPIPIWLTDTNYPAPCPCGRPPFAEPIALVEGEHGLKRWIHASCLQQMMGQGDDD